MPGKGFKNPQSQEKAQHSKMVRRTKLQRASQPPEFVLPPYEDMPTFPPNVQVGNMPDIASMKTIPNVIPANVPLDADIDFLNLPNVAPGAKEPTPPSPAIQLVQKQAGVFNVVPSPPQQAMPVAPLPPTGTPPPPPPETLMTQNMPVVTAPRPSEIEPEEASGTPLPHDTFERAPDLISRGYTPEERAADLIAKSGKAQRINTGPNVAMILILGELLIFANVLVSGQMASMLGKLWQTPSSGTQAVATDTSIRPILLEFLGLQAFLLVLVLLSRLSKEMATFSMTFLLGVWAVWILFVLPDAIKSSSWNNTIDALFPGAGIKAQPRSTHVNTLQQQENKMIRSNMGSGRFDPVSVKYEGGYYTMNGRN